MLLSLDMYQTVAVAVLVLLLGSFLKKRIYFLEKFCIPAPVIGGLLFAIFTCICHVTGIIEFTFDNTLREVCMVLFFTSVGFQANLKVLKSGGKSMAVFLGLVITINNSTEFPGCRSFQAHAHQPAYRYGVQVQSQWLAVTVRQVLSVPYLKILM